MIKIRLLLFFFAIGTGVSAQVAVDTRVVYIPGAAPGISLVVEEEESGLPMPGAHVRLVIAPQDTVDLTTDRLGRVGYFRRIPPDSLGVIVSFLGYKTLTYTHKITTPVINLRAVMQVDPFELSSVVITGNQVAVVFRGDTTVYHAAAFKTMQGDQLSALLEKLPGITVREGALYAHGRKVHRVLINGSPLFSDDIRSALRLIEAEEVKEVAVYDAHAPMDVASGDTLKEKERVLDVKTRSEKQRIRQVSLMGAVGGYPDKSGVDESRELYSLQGRADSHVTGDNLSATAGYGENAMTAGIPANTLGHQTLGMFSWEKSPADYHYRFSSNFSYTGDNRIFFDSSEQDYFPTADYNTRTLISAHTREFNDLKLNWDNTFSYLPERRRISFRIQYRVDQTEQNTQGEESTRVDESEIYRSNLLRRDKKTEQLIGFGGAYICRFKKSGRRLQSEWTFSHHWQDGKDHSIDTLPGSSRELFLTGDLGGHKNSWSGRTRYTEPITAKSTLSLAYNLQQQREESKNISDNRISGDVDTNNSHDFTRMYQSHEVAPQWSFYNGSSISSVVRVQLRFLEDIRKERLPDETTVSVRYFNIIPYYSFKYTKGVNLLEATYTVKITTPTPEERRGILRTYDAPVYSSGNPGLRESVNHSLAVKLNTMTGRTFATWDFSLTADIYRHAHVIREYFFLSPAVLPEYGDFEFPAGSILQQKTNAPGRISLRGDINYSVRSKWLASVVRYELRYNYLREPYYLETQLNHYNKHHAYFTVNLTTNFSRRVEASLRSITEAGFSNKERENNLREIAENLKVSIRWDVLKNFRINPDVIFKIRNYSTTGTLTREWLLHTNFCYTFGKENRWSTTLYLFDLLNQVREQTVSIGNDYINTQRSSMLGRSICLHFSHRF